MDSETIIITMILLTHWVADFVFQTHWQATNKATNNIALLTHVTTYTLVWFVVAISCVILMRIESFEMFTFSMSILRDLIWFFPITFTLHFITDWITSRWAGYFYEKNNLHNFFVVIGLDQFIHIISIYLTLRFLT